MRKTAVKLSMICALLLLWLPMVSAQQAGGKIKARPDLSGTWELDREKSHLGQSGNRVTLTIVHRDPELKISRPFEAGGQKILRELTYYTDGRGETNPSEMLLTDGRASLKNGGDADLSKSTTRWKNERLVTRAILRQRLSGHLVESEVIEEWKLSADGKTLTQTTRLIFRPDTSDAAVFVPSGAPDLKRVYIRVSN